MFFVGCDPPTGQFTQEDPTGLAGGLNLYGFAGGDPINFSDPFGLCREGDEDCHWLVDQLRGVGNVFFNTIASIYDEGDFKVELVAGTDRDFDRSGVNSDDNPNETKLGETFPNSNVYLNKDVGMGDLMFAAAHEAWLHVNLGGLSDAGEKPNDVWESSIAEKQNKAGYARWNLAIYRQLPLNLRQSATEALNMVGVRP